jgi:hypothetical protein
MIPLLDLKAPIVPAVGLGGFEVGRHMVEYQELLSEDFRGVTPRVHGLWQVVYRLSQLWTPSDEDMEASFDYLEDFRRKKEAGIEVTLENPFETPESDPAIDLWVDIRDGIVDAVTALPGYEGQRGSLRAGMTYREARRAEPRMTDVFFLDETTIVGVEGVSLWFDPADPEPEQRDEARLEGIVVFDPTRSDDGIKSM